MEGIPDHHEVIRSRGGLTGGLGATAHPPTRVPRPKAEDTARCSSREGERGVGVTQERDRGVRGSIVVDAVGRKRPRSGGRP